MLKKAHHFVKTDPGMAVPEPARLTEGWLLNGEIRPHSPHPLASRRDITDKLIWLLRQKNCDHCGVMELRRFFAYVSKGQSCDHRPWAPVDILPVAG